MEKCCPRCTNYFPADLEHFYPDRTKKDKLSSYCRPCRRAHSQNWLRENKERGEATRKAYRDRVRRHIKEAKSKPCTDCGNSYPWYAMDFHHLGGKKEFGISKALAGGMPVERVQAEIEKCVLLCATCHRMRHPRADDLYTAPLFYQEAAA